MVGNAVVGNVVVGEAVVGYAVVGEVVVGENVVVLVLLLYDYNMFAFAKNAKTS